MLATDPTNKGTKASEDESQSIPPNKGGGVTKTQSNKMSGSSKKSKKSSSAPKESFVPTQTWYQDAAAYWANTPATVEGVLGGYGVLSDPDAKGSLEFIDQYVSGESPRISREGHACDCGAGIGRVSKVFLLKVFKSVDLVEQDPTFLKTAKEEYLVEFGNRVQNYICQGLQDFVPEEGKYDAIWAQWCLGHLTDKDLVDFFKRCKKGLKPGGLIFVKENITRREVDIDTQDSSVTRSLEIMKDIFDKAGLYVLKEKEQDGFPEEIFPVYMFALEPIKEFN